MSVREDFLSLLAEYGPMTMLEMCEIANVHTKAGDSAMRMAHENKQVHVHGWRRSLGTKGKQQQVWALGPGEDKPKPRALTHRERNSAYRKRQRERRVLRPVAPATWMTPLLA